MFETSDYPKALDEDLFDSWLEKGRESKIQYNFMMIIWDSYESDYHPVYTEERDAFLNFDNSRYSSGTESLVAVYDLYSESRILLTN